MMGMTGRFAVFSCPTTGTAESRSGGLTNGTIGD